VTPLLAAEGLGVRFAVRGRGQLRALDGVSLTVRHGETFGVIGESGSGKSTLGRVIVGLQPPSAGTVRHAGTDLYALPAAERRRFRRDWQIIFQDPAAALDPRMTILESVREPLDIAGEGSRASRTARAMEMLARVGLNDSHAKRHPHELSGGQKQRVTIARALTLRPKLLVCDEAVSALDVSIQAEILNLFAALQREFALTYVFITHNLGVVAHVADRIAVMYLGRIVELADAAALTSRPLHPYTEALLSAEPPPLPPSMQTARRIVLQGEIPSPIDPPSGCRFRTRCRHAAPRCAAEEPAWREIEPDRHVACHFAGTVTGQPATERESHVPVA
jgi:peptide/nickel transport system ATP-binding protein/oligopeptide transport system ATP-binding protein